jgi:hypothetical protein
MPEVLPPELARDLCARPALRIGDAVEAAGEQPLLGGRGADDQLERARPVASSHRVPFMSLQLLVVEVGS